MQQRGFTLLELLVVVGIMSIIAGITLTHVGHDRHAKVKQQAVQAEMAEIRKAIKRYLADNFVLPASINFAELSDTRHPADFSFLFEKPSDTNTWSNDYQAGWRGPYLRQGDFGRVKHNQQYLVDGSINPVALNKDLNEFTLRAIPDPFQSRGQQQSTQPCHLVLDLTERSNGCYWAWYYLGTNSEQTKRLGHPYLLLGEQSSELRLVSLGRDGRLALGHTLAGGACTRVDEENPPQDDIVLCIN